MPNIKKTLLRLLCSLSVSAIYTPLAFADCDFYTFNNGFSNHAGIVTDKGLIKSGDANFANLEGRVEFVKKRKLKKGVVEAINVYSSRVEHYRRDDGKKVRRTILTELAGSIKLYNDGQSNIYDATGKQVAFLTGENTITSIEGHEVGAFSMECSASTTAKNKKKGKKSHVLSAASAAYLLTHIKSKADKADVVSEKDLLDL